MSTKFKLVVGIGSAVVLAGSVLGISAVSAQVTRPEGIFSRVSEILNLPEDKLQSAFQQAQIEDVEAAYENNEISKEEYEDIKDRIGNSDRFMFGATMHKGIGRKGMHDRFEVVKNVVEQFNISIEEMHQARLEGKSLKQFLEEKNISISEFSNALRKYMGEGISQAFEDGKIDEIQKDNMVSRIDERIEHILNKTDMHTKLQRRLKKQE
jgi:hypothetical protein